MALNEQPTATLKRPRLLSRHLAWLNQQPMLIFTLLMAVYGILARLVLVIVPVAFALAGHPVPSLDWQPSLFAVLVVAPLLETFLGQWLPLFIAIRLKATVRVQVAVSTLVFSLVHLPDVSGALMAITPGIALAYTYVTWRSRGKHKGYWATALTHFWLNGAATLLSLVIH